MDIATAAKAAPPVLLIVEHVRQPLLPNYQLGNSANQIPNARQAIAIILEPVNPALGSIPVHSIGACAARRGMYAAMNRDGAAR